MYRSGGKRALDLALATAALALLWPLIAATALLVRIALGTPVLFGSPRAGRGGRPFTLWKFRSMTDARRADGSLLPDGDRLTAVGRRLRATSIDELPELWNVFRGEMSIVGPRPLHLHYLPRYDARQARRHEVCPGITGPAQVSGRNALSWEERFELDVRYVDGLSLRVDAAIVLRTIWKVLAREGISQAGQATMDEFRGSEHLL